LLQLLLGNEIDKQSFSVAFIGPDNTVQRSPRSRGSRYIRELHKTVRFDGIQVKVNDHVSIG
jgi:hypothetical protein